MFTEPISGHGEEQTLKAFAEAWGKGDIKLVNSDGKRVKLPTSLAKVLNQAIELLCSDQPLTIVPVGRLLTTQEAAELLNISRPYLIRLLDQGVIPFERGDGQGSHRRIRFEDLMEYRAKRHSQQRKQLRRLTRLSKAVGLYDD